MLQKADQTLAFQIANYYKNFYANKELMSEDNTKIEKVLLWFKDMKQDENWYWHLVKTELLVLLKNKEAAKLALAETEKRAADMKISDFEAPLLLELKASVDGMSGIKANKKTKTAATAAKKK